MQNKLEFSFRSSTAAFDLVAAIVSFLIEKQTRCKFNYNSRREFLVEAPYQKPTYNGGYLVCLRVCYGFLQEPRS